MSRRVVGKSAERKPGRNSQWRQYDWPSSSGTPCIIRSVIAVTRCECGGLLTYQLARR